MHHINDKNALQIIKFPPDHVADMMRIGIVPQSGDTTNNDPRTFLSNNLVNDSIKVSKAIRCAGQSLYNHENRRMVCFFWIHYTNVIYLSFIVDSTRNSSTGNQELEVDTYHVLDHELIDEEKLAAIIECKKRFACQEDVVLYQYHKMREDTRKKGRGNKNKSLEWSTVTLQALEMDTQNQRLSGSREADHAVGVSVIQIIISIICKHNNWDLFTVYTCTEILKNVLNSELNAELVPGPINSIRMLLTLLMLKGCDAIKITSLMSSKQDLPYQQIIRWGRIQIMSDILRVGAFKLFYEIFAELLLLYKQFIQHIQKVIEEQSSPQVKEFLGQVVLLLVKLSNLIDPTKAIETRRNGLTKTVTTTPFIYKSWILRVESAQYLKGISFFIFGKALHTHEEKWARQLQLLIEFQEKYNHTNVPQTEGKLRGWAKNRDSYIRKDRFQLSVSRS